ncbi:unnamed protein product [Closterium sp. NIES-65]|nr:unnamed protein product [Closterium sp. NIES-65]
MAVVAKSSHRILCYISPALRDSPVRVGQFMGMRSPTASLWHECSGALSHTLPTFASPCLGFSFSVLSAANCWWAEPKSVQSHYIYGYELPRLFNTLLFLRPPIPPNPPLPPFHHSSFSPPLAAANCWWAEPKSVQSHFIYVYELPRRFNVDLSDRLTSHHLSDFHLDNLLFRHPTVQRSNIHCTVDPEAASLFFHTILPMLHPLRPPPPHTPLLSLRALQRSNPTYTAQWTLRPLPSSSSACHLPIPLIIPTMHPPRPSLFPSHLSRALQRSNIHRTVDPEAASLFFLPVLPMLHLALRLPSLEAPSLALAAAAAGRGAAGRGAAGGGRAGGGGAGGGGAGGGGAGGGGAGGNGLELSLEHWEALADTGRYVGEALLYVQSQYPYWRRSGGSDHFIIASHPYGRCGILPFVNPSLLGSLFTLQPSSYPDLLFRSVLHLTPTAAAAAAARRRAAAGSKQTTAAGRLKAALAGKKRQQEQQEGVGVGDGKGRVGIRQQKLQLQQMSKKERRRGGLYISSHSHSPPFPPLAISPFTCPPAQGMHCASRGSDVAIHPASPPPHTAHPHSPYLHTTSPPVTLFLSPLAPCPPGQGMHCASPGNNVVIPPLLPLTPPIPPDARNRSLLTSFQIPSSPSPFLPARQHRICTVPHLVTTWSSRLSSRSRRPSISSLFPVPFLFTCPPAQDMHCASPGNDVIMPPLLPLTPPIPPDARNRSLPVLVLLGPPHRSPPLPAPPHHSPSLSAPLASPPPAKDIPNENPTSLAHAKHTPTDPIGNEGLTRRLLGEGVTRQSGDDGNNGGGGDWDRHGLWKEGEATSESTKKSTQKSGDDGKGGSGYWDRHGLWKEGEGDDVASADGVAGAAVEGGAAGGAGETGETRAAGEAAAAGESGRAEGWKEDVRRRDEGNGSNEGMGAAGGGFDREAVRGAFMEMVETSNPKGWALLQGFDGEAVTVSGAFMEMVGTSNPKGWALLQLTPHAAAAAMQGAVFCVCLPDASHWHEMVCMAQAVVNGCIPVTFFHHYRHPWLHSLPFSPTCCIPVTFFHHYRHPWLHSLPFSAFSLNIDPMDVHETAMRLNVMLLDMNTSCPILSIPPSTHPALSVAHPPCSAFSLNIDPMDVHETAMRPDVMLLDMSLLWRMQTELHSVQYDAFSLNIDPMDVHETAMRLDVMLLDMSLLWRMQTELHSVQQRLLYNESAPISAVDQVSHSLP